MTQTIDERLTKAEGRILELEKENQDRLIPSVKEAGRRIVLLEDYQKFLINELVQRINTEVWDAVRQFQAHLAELQQDLNQEQQVAIKNIRKIVTDDLAKEAAQKVGGKLAQLIQVTPTKIQPQAYIRPPDAPEL